MYGYIYKTTNKLNGKIYIGQHKCEFFDESYYGSGKIIKRAIKKNDLENFKVEIIKECASPEELDESEKYYISEYSSRDSHVGYNLASGGNDGNRDLKWCNNGTEERQYREILPEGFYLGRLSMTEEQRQKMSYPKSENTKRKLSKARLGKIIVTDGLQNKMIDKSDLDYYISLGFKKVKYGGRAPGYKHTPETKRKISESNKGREMTPEVCEKIRASVKKVTGDLEWRKVQSLKTKAACTIKGKHWYNNGEKQLRYEEGRRKQ